MGVWARRETPRDPTAHFYFFDVSLRVFLNRRNAAGSSGPETDSLVEETGGHG